MQKLLYHNKKVIPRHVYQTWSTKDIPKFMKKTIDHNKEQNPDFIFHLYDDADCRNFIKQHYTADVLSAYDGLKPGAYKADLWRYCILYMYGGIYMDVKIKLLFNFSLSELIYSEHYVRDIDGPIFGIYNAFMVHEPLSITGPELFGKMYKTMDYNMGLIDIIHTPNGKLSYKNKIIGVMYPQYREEQHVNGLHYSELWRLKEVY